ncbi:MULTISPECIES: hypothetical protein [Microvirgula]|uniref:hypothetical protein n=1 Tax=Microvirgula TaxID=57479 RepID=UPI0011BE784E|nr:MULTISPECIES: hypothetical protein [Microvirgula]
MLTIIGGAQSDFHQTNPIFQTSTGYPPESGGHEAGQGLGSRGGLGSGKIRIPGSRSAWPAGSQGEIVAGRAEKTAGG